MTALRIPVDEVAEQGLAGVAVSSAHGYSLAVDHGICAAHFYVPTCRRAFEAAGAFGHLSGVDDESLQHRLREVAVLAELPLSEVRLLRDCRPVMRDKSGSLAKRVLRAAEARSVMSLCDSLYSRLGSGERVDMVLTDLAPDVRQLLGISA